MPKVHNIGAKHFVQVVHQPLQWGFKVCSKGWTQEIEEPFRYATPLLIKLPRKYVLVMGKWVGSKSEEDALNFAVQGRDVTYDDFTKEAGWTPAPNQDAETDWEVTNI